MSSTDAAAARARTATPSSSAARPALTAGRSDRTALSSPARSLRAPARRLAHVDRGPGGTAAGAQAQQRHLPERLERDRGGHLRAAALALAERYRDLRDGQAGVGG